METGNSQHLDDILVLTDTFGVTLDFFVGDKDVPDILHDQTMLVR